jgi:uncharacterized RDD family membrane protein YckC
MLLLYRHCEIRNPKSEIRNKFKYQRRKSQTGEQPVWDLDILDFGIVSDFGFRISDLLQPVLIIALTFYRGMPAMSWSDNVNIETPEQIELSLEPAGLGSRFVAEILDILIKIVTLLLAFIAALIVIALLGVSPNILMVGAVGALLFFVGYDIYFELSWNGQTPGKKAAGIRVIREGGAPLDFRSACIRNVLKIADFMPSFFLLGGIMVLLTPRRQRLGDLAAGTIVIRERVANAPAEVSVEIARLASDEFNFTPDQLSACSPADRSVLRSFFLRYHDMEPGPRDDLAYRLSRIFLEKTAYPLPSPLRNMQHVDTFLACLYRDMEKWARLDR